MLILSTTEAWTDATQSKQEVVLNPVRVPSRVGDMSSDERSPREDVSPRESKSILYLDMSELVHCHIVAYKMSCSFFKSL